MDQDTLLLIGKAGLALFGATSVLVLWGCAALAGRVDELEDVRAGVTARAGR